MTDFQLTYRGIATADPTAGTHDGLQLHFSALTLHGDSGTREGVLSSHLFQGAMLANSFRNDAGHHTIGSATMVGPGLAIGAYHVWHDYMDALQSDDAAAVCEAPTADGLLLWEVRKLTVIPQSDLVLIGLALRSSLPSENHFYKTAPTTRMPAVGETLMLCGFSAAEGTQPRGREIHIRADLRFTRGTVIDRFPDGRDSLMMPGPTLALDCAAFGGMSGGPVFDARGYLVGIVSSSSEGEQIAYVSHVWPALVRGEVEPVWPVGLGIPKGTLLYLGKRWSIDIDRPDAFVPVAVRGRFGLEYRPWT